MHLLFLQLIDSLKMLSCIPEFGSIFFGHIVIHLDFHYGNIIALFDSEPQRGLLRGVFHILFVTLIVNVVKRNTDLSKVIHRSGCHYHGYRLVPRIIVFM